MVEYCLRPAASMPTAWMWPFGTGQIQAVGIDAAGRKQYLYHPDWRTRRDQLKFQRATSVTRWNLSWSRRVRQSGW